MLGGIPTLPTNRYSSGLTIENYVRDIKGVLSFEETPPEVTAIDPSHIRKHITHLDVLGRARSTINQMLCALKTFFKFLMEIVRVIQESPAAKVRCGKKIPT